MLFRNLQGFHSLFEASGISTIVAPDGEVWCLEDLDWLYAQRVFLPTRQREAIELCLYENHRETDAAVMMGVSPTNPVSQYAADGLVKLLKILKGEMVDPEKQYKLWQAEAQDELEKLDKVLYPIMAAKLRERISTLDDALEILSISVRSNGKGGRRAAVTPRDSSPVGGNGRRTLKEVS